MAELAIGKEHGAGCQAFPCTGAGYVSEEGWGPMKQEHLGNIKSNQGQPSNKRSGKRASLSDHPERAVSTAPMPATEMCSDLT